MANKDTLRMKAYARAEAYIRDKYRGEYDKVVEDSILAASREGDGNCLLHGQRWCPTPEKHFLNYRKAYGAVRYKGHAALRTKHYAEWREVYDSEFEYLMEMEEEQ